MRYRRRQTITCVNVGWHGWEQRLARSWGELCTRDHTRQQHYAVGIWHQQLVVSGHATVWSDRPRKVREADNRSIAYYEVSLRWCITHIQADGGVDGNLNTDAKQPSQ